MFTVAETETFTKQSKRYWGKEECDAFITFIANHPDAGDTVPGSGGVRKVRWRAKGKGKSGGVRVIYYNMLERGTIWLLLIYGKNVKENIPANVLRQVKEVVENDW